MATDFDEEKVAYAFGHMISSMTPHAHSGDSGDLARECFEEMGFDERTIQAFFTAAQDVSDNYDYHGHGDEMARKIKAGEA